MSGSSKKAPLGAPITLTSAQFQPRRPAANGPVIDSWEDESDDDASHFSTEKDNDTGMTSPADGSPVTTTYIGSNLPPHHGIRAPPPTPAVSRQSSCRSNASNNGNNESPRKDSTRNKRPEKQTATANRMIAGALGMRTQRTEQQKAYDKSALANERKRRDLERAAEAMRKAEAEKAKTAVWDD